MKWFLAVGSCAAPRPGVRRYLSGRMATRCREQATHLSAGFTLIELMIVLVIVAILAAVAFPAYTNYLTRTHRAAAEACLSEYSNYMERYYTTNLTYSGSALPDLACASDSQTGPFYSYALLPPATSSTYTVTASPQGSQASRDTECGSLKVDQTGTRQATGPGSVAKCW